MATRFMSDEYLRAKLHLADLAGSEQDKRIGSNGMRFKEGHQPFVLVGTSAARPTFSTLLRPTFSTILNKLTPGSTPKQVNVHTRPNSAASYTTATQSPATPPPMSTPRAFPIAGHPAGCCLPCRAFPLASQPPLHGDLSGGY